MDPEVGQIRVAHERVSRLCQQDLATVPRGTDPSRAMHVRFDVVAV